MVVAQKPTQSLPTLHGPHVADNRILREQQDIALSLMISLGMEMFDIFAEGERYWAHRMILRARRNERSPKRTTLDKHSSFTERTQRSA